MGFNFEKNSDNDNVYEDLKILSTTIEALNKQINDKSINSKVINELNRKVEELNSNFSLINSKLNYLYSELSGNNLLPAKDKNGKDLDFVKDIDNAYARELAKVNKSLEKNEIVIHLLKSTVELLNETVTILKDKISKNG